MSSKVDFNEVHENNLRKYSDNLSKAAKELNRCYLQDDSYQEKECYIRYLVLTALYYLSSAIQWQLKTYSVV